MGKYEDFLRWSNYNKNQLDREECYLNYFNRYKNESATRKLNAVFTCLRRRGNYSVYHSMRLGAKRIYSSKESNKKSIIIYNGRN